MTVPAGIPDEAVQAQLRKILVSRPFIHSERLRRFLRFCIEQAALGKPENLREYPIAIEVFDRPDSYNPATDPIVRVEARRLRSKLREYYEAEGRDDAVIIDVPKGSYIPSFELRKQPASPRKAPWKMIAGVAIVTAIAVWAISRQHEIPTKLTLSRLTSNPGLTTDAAISADASLVAYASDRSGKGDLDIWLQQVAGGDPIQLTRDPADDHQPSFSPDGTAIVFRSEREPFGIYTVSTLGGDARLLARDGRDPHVSPDGKTIAFWVGSPGDDFLQPAGKLYLKPSGESPARQLCADFVSASFPVWSPDGTRLLFEGSRDSPTMPNRSFDWWIVSINSGNASKTGIFDTLLRNNLRLYPGHRGAVWVRDKLIFAATNGDSTNLWQLPVSGGSPQRLTLGSSLEVGPSVATNGAIAFSSLAETVDIWSLRINANRGEMPSWMERVTEAAAKSVFPSVSADGKMVAYLSNKSRGNRLWVKNLETGLETTVGQAQARYPQMNAESTKVAFTEGQELFVAPASGGGAERMCTDCGRPWDWSRDGTRMLYVGQGSPTSVGELTIGSGSKRILLKHDKYDLAGARFSPDNRWITFHAIVSPTQRQVFIAAYHPDVNPDANSDANWIAVTDGNGLDRNSTWSPDGNLLYYLSERDGFRCIWAQRLDPRSKRPLGPAFPAAHFHSARRSLSRIGDVGAIGLSAVPEKLVFSLSEVTGNVWIARPEPNP
jgi:Tol biopolymer transport system component